MLAFSLFLLLSENMHCCYFSDLPLMSETSFFSFCRVNTSELRKPMFPRTNLLEFLPHFQYQLFCNLWYVNIITPFHGLTLYSAVSFVAVIINMYHYGQISMLIQSLNLCLLKLVKKSFTLKNAGLKPRALYMIGKFCTTELPLQPKLNSLMVQFFLFPAKWLWLFGVLEIFISM